MKSNLHTKGIPESLVIVLDIDKIYCQMMLNQLSGYCNRQYKPSWQCITVLYGYNALGKSTSNLIYFSSLKYWKSCEPTWHSGVKRIVAFSFAKKNITLSIPSTIFRNKCRVSPRQLFTSQLAPQVDERFCAACPGILFFC